MTQRCESAAIATGRLELVPMTPEFLRACLEGRMGDAQKAIGASIPDDWPDIRPILAQRLRQLEADPALQPWLLRAMVLRGDRTMVGHIGFHSAPAPDYLREWCPGGVEFGFTVFAPYRRHGYAREASLGVMRWAGSTHGVAGFVLTISPGNLASRSLAASLGFLQVGSHRDDVDGIEDVFVRHGVPGA